MVQGAEGIRQNHACVIPMKAGQGGARGVRSGGGRRDLVGTN